MNEQTGFNPKRRLCPDGSCTGVLGADGRCGECGRTAAESARVGAGDGNGQPNFGDLADMADMNDVADLEADMTQSEAETALAAEASKPAGGLRSSGSASSGFDPNRRLCDDGTCVGVIGAAGVCTVCGRRDSTK